MAALDEMKTIAIKLMAIASSEFFLERSHTVTPQKATAERPIRIGSRICDAPKIMVSGYNA